MLLLFDAFLNVMAYNGHIIKEANVVGYDKKDFNPLALDGIFCINDWDTASSLFSSFCSSEERIKLALKVGDQLDCMGYQWIQRFSNYRKALAKLSQAMAIMSEQ